jgi:xylulokinase
MTAPKLLWIRNMRNKRYERSQKIVLPKDFVRSRFTGDSYTDWSDANGTGLFDIRKKQWLSEAIEEIGLDETRMPEIKAPFEVVSEIDGAISRKTGLKRGIVVVTGGGDDVVSIGTGAFKPGQCAVNLGTSCSTFASVEKPVLDSKMRLECFVGFEEDSYYLSGTTTSAGGSVDWVNRNIGILASSYHDRKHPSLNRISRPRLKPSGIFFLPYLAGERTPFWDPNAKAAIVGITSTHTRKDLLQSAMEGVSYTVQSILEITEQLTRPKIRTVRVAGALNFNESFMTILASVLNRTLLIPRETETTALGAAMLASIGASQSSDISEAAQRLLSWKTIIKPQRDLVHMYKKSYSQFSQLAEAYLMNMNRLTY